MFLFLEKNIRIMKLKKLEGASEVLGIMLLLACYALLFIIFLYLFQPNMFTPAISMLEKYLQNIINVFNRP